jgi:hypothetical protein
MISEGVSITLLYGEMITIFTWRDDYYCYMAMLQGQCHGSSCSSDITDNPDVCPTVRVVLELKVVLSS